MTGVRVHGRLDGALAWDGERLWRDADLQPRREWPATLDGLAGSAEGPPGGPWRIARDRLGLGKLFWAPGSSGDVELASLPVRLVEQGHALADIRAVPRDFLSDLPGGGPARSPREEVERAAEPPAAAIRAALDAYLAAIARAYPSRAVYVCLSGGLDSSGIASLVCDHFPAAVAVSFELDRGGRQSDDRLAAERVASELGLPLLEATADGDELLGYLDAVLANGADWRDFNVHAGLVNACLAATIRTAEQTPDTAPLVFTGDLANEFLVDYHAETYAGVTHYRLPRLAPAALRSGLVEGLDTSHREVGVFGGWALSVVQPYAVAVDAYMSIPEQFLELPDRKERLCREVFGERLPGFVYERPKARAQTGGAEGGGVLGLCVDEGIDGQWLRRRFCKLHGGAPEAELGRFIRAGRYRSAAPLLEGDADEPG
ncbi:MAG TPA: asparagine synthase-related protein [Thermoleophilaceae bacterium]|nr:asparagine synthase-related protein [Thermoleophilaceae bacterium]